MGFYRDKKRKDWIYKFQYQGKNYGGRGFSTKKDAMAAREERKKELKQQHPVVTGMAFSEVCDMYLDFAQRKFAVETYKYKTYVYKSFYQFMGGDHPIIDITPEMVSKYLATRHSNNNYNVHRRELSALFTYCKDVLEKIIRNPCKKIDKLPHTVAEKQIPQESDISELILAADPQTDEKDLLIVLLHTMARIDEALRLTWQDINFEKKTLTKWTRKTRDGSFKKIMVSINEELYDTLWKMWQHRKQEKWVFYNDRAETRYMNRPKFMKGLCKRAGIIPHFGFHTLRHLMASLMSDNPKTSTKTIQKILGHSKMDTTEIYLHELDGAIENAMDALSGRFTPIPEPTPLDKLGNGE